jgi:1-phosphatidylinositol-3-phosphate 5-kinase
MIARAYLRLGGGNITVGYAVRFLSSWTSLMLILISGQIFCSRCASNIIKGSRFGHDGMVRVCNLCLEKLATVDDDDDDDRRSVVSMSSPFPAHQMGIDSFTMNLGHQSQSPFAASQLFGRTDEPFNLYSIAETKRPVSATDDSIWGSRPITPGANMMHDEQTWEPVSENPAPFRRGLTTDEEKDLTNIHNGGFNNDDSPIPPGSKTPIDFPITVPVSIEGLQMPTSSIQFPGSSPEHGLDSPRPGSAIRSRFNSYGDFDVPTPFIRSRVQSRLDFIPGEPGWRTRRESTAYVVLFFL